MRSWRAFIRGPSAFRVLQVTEEVEDLPALATFMAGVAAFTLRLEPVQVGLVVFASAFVFRMVHLFGLFILPFTFLLPISRVYGFVSGYGVLLAGLIDFRFFHFRLAGRGRFCLGTPRLRNRVWRHRACVR